MNCQICGDPASVHLTDIVNKKKREVHLCERCAREQNLIPPAPGPQIDLKALLKLLLHPPFDESTDGLETPSLTCEACQMTFSEFKAGGRLGCPHDYEALRPALEPLLERIHRSLEHLGKTPHAVRIHAWRRQMQEAVAAENYEEAARLRDLIRRAEQ